MCAPSLEWSEDFRPIIKVNDINMYYEIHGQGEPLLLIMGMGADLTMWGDSVYKLAEKYQVIAFDNRGAGRTDKPDIPYSIEMMADDTVELMDRLNIDRARFLGASMGSCIAQMVAANYPERVNGLILHVAFARVARGFFRDIFSMIWPLILRMPGIKEKLGTYPPTSRSLLRQTEAVSRFDSRGWLDKIKAPTLIVNGTNDFIVGPMKYTEELATGIAGSKLILFEGGHICVAENQDLLIKPALKFLEEVDAKSAVKTASSLV
jgi:pimeloyl-ACP methyl ester carboxylesterase